MTCPDCKGKRTGISTFISPEGNPTTETRVCKRCDAKGAVGRKMFSHDRHRTRVGPFRASTRCSCQAPQKRSDRACPERKSREMSDPHELLLHQAKPVKSVMAVEERPFMAAFMTHSAEASFSSTGQKGHCSSLVTRR